MTRDKLKMFKDKAKIKNNYSCNELITNAMVKRRRLALNSISSICNKKNTLRVVK